MSRCPVTPPTQGKANWMNISFGHTCALSLGVICAVRLVRSWHLCLDQKIRIMSKTLWLSFLSLPPSLSPFLSLTHTLSLPSLSFLPFLSLTLSPSLSVYSAGSAILMTTSTYFMQILSNYCLYMIPNLSSFI